MCIYIFMYNCIVNNVNRVFNRVYLSQPTSVEGAPPCPTRFTEIGRVDRKPEAGLPPKNSRESEVLRHNISSEGDRRSTM